MVAYSEMNVCSQSFGCAELVVPCDLAGVARRVRRRTARGSRRGSCLSARAGFDEHVLVVVADLVTEVAEHRAVRLAEPHPQRFSVGVERLDEIDGDHAVGMTDRHRLALAVARQQIEGQSARRAPERFDRQADVAQLVRPAGATRRRWAPTSLWAMVSSASGSRRISESGRHRPAFVSLLLLGDQPIAAQRFDSGCSGSSAARRRSRRRRRPPASTSSAGEDPPRSGSCGSGPPRTARSCCTPDRRTRARHNMVSRCNCFWSDMRFRFAANLGRAPIRTCPRRASSRRKRLPEALARFPITRVVSSPQVRAVQTAQPVADAAGPDRRDRRTARRVRPRHGALHPDRADRRRVPEELERLASGHLPSGVDEDAFLARINAAVRDLVAAGDHEDTVAVFSHGGVINGLLHSILGTEKILCVNVDYAGVTRLLSSRDGQPVCGRRQRHRTRMGPAAAKPAMVDKSSDHLAGRARPRRPGPPPASPSASPAPVSCAPSSSPAAGPT